MAANVGCDQKVKAGQHDSACRAETCQRRGGEKGAYALACAPWAGSMYLIHAGDGIQATATKRIESVQAPTDQA